MALNFPSSPVNGTTYTAPTGVEYRYDGEKWITVGSQNAIVDLPATYVAVAGDTMTGQLTLPGGGTGSQAATVDQVDAVQAASLPLTGGALTGDLSTTGDVQAASLNSGPLAGFRNQIINGDFRINQRNGTRTPGVGVYGFDRWKGHAGGLEQIVEALPAGQWTLSWSGGGNGTFGGTTAASPITATVAGGDTSVVVPSAATNVQLEPGPVATPFEHRPIGTELALCQRYYETVPDAYYVGTMVGDGSTERYYRGTVWFRTTKRVSPTVSRSSASYRWGGVTRSDLSERNSTGFTDSVFFEWLCPSAPTANGGSIEINTKSLSADAEL